MRMGHVLLGRMAVAVLASACLISAARFAPAMAQPVKIGLSGPFTGGSASMGVSMRDGVKLAVGEINKAGGVLGRQIVLVERDDEAKNEVSVQIAQELVNKEQVVAILGFINTGVALASQRFYQEAEIPVLNNVATGTLITQQFIAPKAKANYVFRFSANDVIQSGMMVNEAIAVRGFKAPAILADSTNYGQLGREDLEKALAATGIKPATVEKFNIGDTDMTAQLLRAKQANADVILTYGIGPELAQIANGMAKLGWKLPIIGSWTLSMSTFIDNAGPNGEGALMPQTFIQSPSTPKRKAFIEPDLGRPGLRQRLRAGRRHHPGEVHRRPQNPRGAGKPADQGRRRGHGLRQAVQRHRPRGDHRQHPGVRPSEERPRGRRQRRRHRRRQGRADEDEKLSPTA